MEAKVLLRRRDVHRTYPTVRSPVRLSFVRKRVRDHFREICSFVLGVLKTRDPFVDFFFSLTRPKKEDCHSDLLLNRGNFAAVIPGNSTAEFVIVNGFLNFLSLYNFALVGRLILTWFPSRPPALERPLSTICDPYLNLFRGIIPPVGGIDFSPVLAFVVLSVFTNAASAIPAELPKPKKREQGGCL